VPQLHGRVNATAVDPGSVQRVQIFELELTPLQSDEGVPTRDLRIVDDDVGITTPEHSARFDLEATAA